MSGKSGGFRLDPAAVRKTSAHMHEHGAKVTGHGQNLKARTSGRVGHGEIGQIVDNFVTTAMTGVSEAFTKAASDLGHGFGKGLESVAQRAEKAEGEAQKAFKSLDRRHSVHGPSLNHEAPVGVIAPLKSESGPRNEIPGPRVEMVNGYRYEVDGLGRTTRTRGPLQLDVTQGRNEAAQLAAGGPDRLKGDDGGHLFGRRFKGPLEPFNHFAQDRNFNRGVYKTLENRWHKALTAGKPVFVDIKATYPEGSLRPSQLNIAYTIDGEPRMQQFFNRPGGK